MERDCYKNDCVCRGQYRKYRATAFKGSVSFNAYIEILLHPQGNIRDIDEDRDLAYDEFEKTYGSDYDLIHLEDVTQ